MKKLFSVKSIAVLAVFSAIAYALMFVSRYLPPLIPAVPFLKYDPKDFVIVIVGFLFGPLGAFLVTVVVSLLEFITVSGTGIIGLVMNVLSTSFFVLPAAIIYRMKRTTVGAVLGLTAGVILMTLIMLLWNYLITPLYMTVSREAVAKMLLPAFLPFNLIKAGLNMAFALLTYKPIVSVLRKTHVLPESTADPNRKFAVWVPVLGAVLLISGILLILVFRGVF
ncbi:MAG: ECF transporter S component [Lachnospiraceae bacterium]|nr:ECF transporter S component [Lachnospiraceae bacterium]MBR4768721.1 ECF transporter S component [Lachnospiraceae bacterium]